MSHTNRFSPNRSAPGPSSPGYPHAEQRRAYELRREREIGNWGRASEHIGRRWEVVGFSRLEHSIVDHRAWPTDGCRPEALVPLMDNPAIQATLMQIGLPSPDVVVVVRGGDGALGLQAVDFKWDLEFARYDQIRRKALEALLARDNGVLCDALTSAAGQPAERLAVLDGLFFAPDSPNNRHFAASSLNHRQEYPIEEHEVIFEVVTPEEFFLPLPAWGMAVRLAELDRATHSLRLLDSGEHYYRLGAGVLGAVGQLRASVFETDPPMPDADSAMAWLRPRVSPLSTSTLVSHVERLMALRAQHVQILRRLRRSPFRLVDLTRSLSRRGVVLPERGVGSDGAERERWMGVLRRVDAEYRAKVLRAGLKLVQQGMSDADALARLETNKGTFETGARALAERLIAGALS